MSLKNSKKKLYQRIFLLFFLFTVDNLSFSQQSGTVIPQDIPPFNIVLNDGITYFKSIDLEKNKTTAIVYFDPDCDHCKKFTTSILKNIRQFRMTQIVMICGTGNINALKRFVAEFSLLKYPMIKVGTEGIYHAVMNFYHVEVTPFTAVYNRQGKLITYYREVPVVGELAKKLK